MSVRPSPSAGGPQRPGRAPLHRFPIFETSRVAEARADVTMFRRTARFEALGSPDGFRLGVNSVVLDDIRLSAVSTTGHLIRIEDAEHASVLLPWRGTIATENGQAEQRARPGAIALPRPGMRATRVAPGYVGLVAQVPLARLGAAAAANPEDPPRPGWPARVPPGSAGTRSLVRFLHHLVAELDEGGSLLRSRRATEGAAALVTGLLLEFFRAAEEEGAAPPPAAGVLRVRRAEALMRARLQDPISVPMVAAEVGVSTRALQIAFREHRGMTPRAFLGACRLGAVRERLLRAGPDESVTRAAFDCGVTHLGRFAAEYRARFGEPPSATLARAQRKA